MELEPDGREGSQISCDKRAYGENNQEADDTDNGMSDDGFLVWRGRHVFHATFELFRDRVARFWFWFWFWSWSWFFYDGLGQVEYGVSVSGVKVDARVDGRRFWPHATIRPDNLALF